MDSVLESIRNLEQQVTKINENLKTLMQEDQVPKKEFLEKHSKDKAKSNTVKTGCRCVKTNCISKICSCVKKKKKCNSSCRCVQTCQNEKLLDPMRPSQSCELSRPSEKDSKKKDNASKSQQRLEQLIDGLNIEGPNTQVVGEVVDWEQHAAQLVPCKKCKRTFWPDRIQKHESCCKKV